MPLNEGRKEVDESSTDNGYSSRKWGGLVGGPVVFVAMLLVPAPESLGAAGWYTAAVGLLMAIWWMTEALPIPVTALLPVALFPLLDIRSVGDTTAPYANPLIFLFLGGFLIAIAMQRWNLHRRIALRIIRIMGAEPRALMAGIMIAAAFLSMWISNTATAMMLLPIGLSLVELARSKGEAPPERIQAFAVGLMLAIAYACNIGGVGTLIGTPPNALLAGFLDESYGVEVGFAQWMAMGIPVVAVGLPLTFLLLTRWLFPVGDLELVGGDELVRRELHRLGRIRGPELMVGGVFVGVALLWISRPLLEPVVPGLSDAGIAMIGGLLLFILPVDLRSLSFVLDWKSAKELPWDVLILFGGGLSLAAAIEATGLASWIGEGLAIVGGLPILLVVLVVSASIVALTEVTSNTATAAAFLPIMASVAVGIGENPFLLIIPVALATSSAFMLPVATPPNAIVYGSDMLTIPRMARAGVWVNLLFVLLITVAAYGLVPLVFGVEIGTVPAWADGG